MNNDILSLLTSHSGSLSIDDILLSFLVAMAMGAMIYASYRFAFSGAVYSARFNVSLVMLTLVTTLVMSVIGNNIALSLGMVGALSIVRFRTAIKDPRDTAYIFWCIAVGICCGVCEYMIAMIGSGVIFLFLLLFGVVSGSERFLLIIRAKPGKSIEIESKIDFYFESKARLRASTDSADGVEYIYEVSGRMLDVATEQGKPRAADALLEIDGIETVNLICQNDEINR